MSIRGRLLVVGPAITLTLLVCIHMVCGESSKLPGIGASPANRAVPQPEPPKKQDYHSMYEARYEWLYAMYVQNIDKVAERRKERRIRNYKDQLTERRRRGLELARKQPQVLETLRNQAATGKLMYRNSFPFPSEELMAAINPTVDASAEIFAELRRDQAIDMRPIAVLCDHAEHLAKRWVPILNEIVAEQGEHSQDLKWAVRILYRAGIDREKHRPTLERWAVEKQDPVALDILLFDRNKVTGEPIPVRSPANEKLVKTLSVNESLPEHRLVCADYAAATGDTALAEKICLELVSVRMKAFDNPNDPPSVEESPLARARQGARYLMFYDLRTEKSFRHVHDLSMILEREQIEYADAPRETWKSYGLSARGKTEIEQARGLIDEVVRESKKTEGDR